MKYGPLVFLAAFFALSASWFGFILMPQIQLGRVQPETNLVNTAEVYPQGRPGLARQGLEVYRANGCASCHSQQVGQTGTVCDVILSDVGTNPVAAARALINANVGITNVNAPGLSAGLPRPILRGVTLERATAAAGALKAGGGKADVQIVPTGPDISRGWGLRRTVAADFLYDDPVLTGSLRIGPDLANEGLRRTANWQMLHLYAPRSQVNDSIMPPYRFLFEKRKVGERPSPDALSVPGDAPKGFEIVPKPEAKALVAYLLSLRANVPLFEAPMTAGAPAPSSTATNTQSSTTNELLRVPETAPSATATNVPAQ